MGRDAENVRDERAPNNQMQFFRSRQASLLTTRQGQNGAISIARLTGFADEEPLDPHVVEDAFLFVLHHNRAHAALTYDGRTAEVAGPSETKVAAYDYKHRWTAVMRTDYELINWHIPRSAFEMLAPEFKGRVFADLAVAPGVCTDDAVARHLSGLIQPAFDRPGLVSNLYLDHLCWLSVAHFAHTYGEFRAAPVKGRPQLAPWQERLAKSMIESDIAGGVRLAELAAACDLSVSHFVRAFKETVGAPPHRWLLERRIELAKVFLRNGERTIAQIAVECGFYDQSHMSRVFKQHVGAAPTEWRRSFRN